MSIQAVLLPLFVEVALTFALLFWTGALRNSGLRSGVVKESEIALRQPGWPPRTMQVGNSFSNQFELPSLFYVLTILALIAKQADLLFVVLAWIFVALRLVHAFVHVTSNRVALRGPIYGFGALVLLAMWVIFAVRILSQL